MYRECNAAFAELCHPYDFKETTKSIYNNQLSMDFGKFICDYRYNVYRILLVL